MNVLSLFNGMDCGGLALGRSGIGYENYFASEIDKHAVKVSKTKFPKHIQIGDVTKVSGKELPKIDLILAGSPCQGFSTAGKGLNFDDPRSKLFFDFLRILAECREKNPDLMFLLENVMMLEQWEQTISKYLFVNPIVINSALVSAQNRVRNYWTNIGLQPAGLFGDLHPTIPQPKDKGEILADILEDEVDEKYFLSESAMARIKGWTKDKRGSRPHRGDESKSGISELGRVCNGTGKSDTVLANHAPKVFGVINRGEFVEKGDKSMNLCASYYKGHDNHGARTMIVCHNRQPRTGDPTKGGTGPLSRTDGKTYALDTQQSNRVQRLHQQDSINYSEGKARSLVVGSHLSAASHTKTFVGERIRRLTPIEVCRLQTVPDDYFFHEGKQIVSDSQIYKMIGNGWTIDVISHILNYSKL